MLANQRENLITSYTVVFWIPDLVDIRFENLVNSNQCKQKLIELMAPWWIGVWNNLVTHSNMIGGFYSTPLTRLECPYIRKSMLLNSTTHIQSVVPWCMLIIIIIIITIIIVVVVTTVIAIIIIIIITIIINIIIYIPCDLFSVSRQLKDNTGTYFMILRTVCTSPWDVVWHFMSVSWVDWGFIRHKLYLVTSQPFIIALGHWVNSTTRATIEFCWNKQHRLDVPSISHPK